MLCGGVMYLSNSDLRTMRPCLSVLRELILLHLPLVGETELVEHWGRRTTCFPCTPLLSAFNFGMLAGWEEANLQWRWGTRTRKHQESVPAGLWKKGNSEFYGVRGDLQILSLFKTCLSNKFPGSISSRSSKSAVILSSWIEFIFIMIFSLYNKPKRS